MFLVHLGKLLHFAFFFVDMMYCYALWFGLLLCFDFVFCFKVYVAWSLFGFVFFWFGFFQSLWSGLLPFVFFLLAWLFQVSYNFVLWCTCGDLGNDLKSYHGRLVGLLLLINDYIEMELTGYRIWILLIRIYGVWSNIFNPTCIIVT